MPSFRPDVSASDGDEGRARASAVDEATLRAYRETEYRVRGGPRVHGEPWTILRIDEPCPALAALHARHRSEASAFITACNPLGVRLDEPANARRQARLEALLAAQGLAFLPGVGQHPNGDWPGETSALVFGLDLPPARALGRRFEQNAILWSGANAVPRLILLR